jgi:conjugal transfer pilus assembly protein TrbC
MSKRDMSVKILIALICTMLCLQAHAHPFPSPKPTPHLLIFISFSMPAQSLKLWAKQAARVNGQLLLQGFVEDSLEKTTAKTLAVFGNEESAEVLINPEAFSQFNIQAVPAVVVTEETYCVHEACPPPHFDVVYGDTDLEEALRWIATKGSAHIKPWARLLLKRYKTQHA